MLMADDAYSDAAYIGGKRVMPFYYFGLLVLAVTRL